MLDCSLISLVTALSHTVFYSIARILELSFTMHTRQSAPLSNGVLYLFYDARGRFATVFADHFNIIVSHVLTCLMCNKKPLHTVQGLPVILKGVIYWENRLISYYHESFGLIRTILEEFIMYSSWIRFICDPNLVGNLLPSHQVIVSIFEYRPNFY